MANIDPKKVVGVSTVEWEDYDKVRGQKITSRLVEDDAEIRNYWPIHVDVAAVDTPIIVFQLALTLRSVSPVWPFEFWVFFIL